MSIKCDRGHGTVRRRCRQSSHGWNLTGILRVLWLNEPLLITRKSMRNCAVLDPHHLGIALPAQPKISGLVKRGSFQKLWRCNRGNVGHIGPWSVHHFREWFSSATITWAPTAYMWLEALSRPRNCSKYGSTTCRPQRSALVGRRQQPTCQRW